jgi:ferredoxin
MQDETALHVHWEERTGNKCGICTACVRACYVGLDVKTQAFDIDCTQCGACVDACDRVYWRKPEPSLLTFAFDPPKKSFLGLNKVRKGFVVAAFSLFLILFLWMTLDRPKVSFRLFNVTGGQKGQESLLIDGKESTPFTLHLNSLQSTPQSYTLGLDDPRFAVVWLDSEADQLSLEPFEKKLLHCALQFSETTEEPPSLHPVTFRLFNGDEAVGTAIFYFRRVVE